MPRPRQTDRIDLSDAPTGVFAAARTLGSVAATGAALGGLAHRTASGDAPEPPEDTTMREHASPAFFLGALALGFAAALAAACPAARADGASDGLGTDALVATVPHGGGGWSNGTAALIAQGGGKYSLSYAGAASGDAGAGRAATIVGNSDGNPVVEYRAPRGAAGLALARR